MEVIWSFHRPRRGHWLVGTTASSIQHPAPFWLSPIHCNGALYVKYWVSIRRLVLKPLRRMNAPPLLDCRQSITKHVITKADPAAQFDRRGVLAQRCITYDPRSRRRRGSDKAPRNRSMLYQKCAACRGRENSIPRAQLCSFSTYTCWPALPCTLHIEAGRSFARCSKRTSPRKAWPLPQTDRLQAQLAGSQHISYGTRVCHRLSSSTRSE